MLEGKPKQKDLDHRVETDGKVVKTTSSVTNSSAELTAKLNAELKKREGETATDYLNRVRETFITYNPEAERLNGKIVDEYFR